MVDQREQDRTTVIIAMDWGTLRSPFPQPVTELVRHRAEHPLLRWWGTYGRRLTRWAMAPAVGGLAIMVYALALGGIVRLVSSVN